MGPTFLNSNDTNNSELNHIPKDFNFKLIFNQTNEEVSQKPRSIISKSTSLQQQFTVFSQIWFISLVGLLVVIIFASLVLLNLRRKNQKAKKLMTLTLKPSKTAQLSNQDDHQIEFVVPNLNVPKNVDNSTYEDSFNKFDCIPLDHDDQCPGTPSSNRFDIKANSIQSSNSIQFPNVGKVNFVVHYSFLRQQLLLTLVSAVDLPLQRKKASLNFFAKVTLLPKKSPKFVTKIQRNTQHPIFNELFIFPIKVKNLEKQTLSISIWNCDRFAKKSFIGQVEYKLKEAGLTSCINTDVISDETCCPLSSLNLKSSFTNKFSHRTFLILNIFF